MFFIKLTGEGETGVQPNKEAADTRGRVSSVD